MAPTQERPEICCRVLIDDIGKPDLTVSKITFVILNELYLQPSAKECYLLADLNFFTPFNALGWTPGLSQINAQFFLK